MMATMNQSAWVVISKFQDDDQLQREKEDVRWGYHCQLTHGDNPDCRGQLEAGTRQGKSVERMQWKDYLVQQLCCVQPGYRVDQGDKEKVKCQMIWNWTGQ